MARQRSKQSHSGTGHSAGSDALYEQMLLFPERAEFLPHSRFSAYRMQLDHWRELSSVFQRAFQSVYERQSASVLLVHGDQGTGKTAFTHKLATDFAESRKGVHSVDRESLWHILTGGPRLDLRTIQEATKTTEVTVITHRANWLADARTAASHGQQKMRVFVIDDFHRDLFLGEWAGLRRSEYLQLKTTARSALLESVAQQIVADCRGDFARSLFVLLSADQQIVGELKDQLDRSHRGLAQTLKLPLPEPEAKEQIVRTNVNRLNQRSYWYCLDQGGPDEKKQAFETLKGSGGFIDSFRAIDQCSDAAPETPANLLVASIAKAPSIADRGATKQAAQAANDALESLTDTDAIEPYMKRFRDGGQGRSQEYERVLTSRFGAYSRGMAVWSSLRPDVIFEEYRPCAVTKASAADPSAIEEAIKRAIRRECHVAEFTAHMQSDLRGLAEYLCKKVLAYAELLESV